MSDPVVIVAAKRTAIGSFSGAFSNTPAHELGATVIKAVLTETGVKVDEVDDVLLGQVLTTAQGQNPARQAAIKAGIPVIPGTEDPVVDPAIARDAAARIGFPLIIKAAFGGGGRGMRVVSSAGEFNARLAEESAQGRVGRVLEGKQRAQRIARHVQAGGGDLRVAPRVGRRAGVRQLRGARAHRREFGLGGYFAGKVICVTTESSALPSLPV